MDETTMKNIIVVGGGYAGLHAIQSLRKHWGTKIGNRIRLILLDKQPYHFRKVVMVKAPARPVDLCVPFQSYRWNHVEFIQGELRDVLSDQQMIQYKTVEDRLETLRYDQLVIAVGSIVKKPEGDVGGFVLEGEADVQGIQEELKSVAMRAEQAAHLEEKERLLHAVVVGGGITGIEIAAELAACLRAKGLSLGLGKNRNVVSLIHAGDRLLPQAPRKITGQLERRLRKSGVSLIKNTRALHYKEGAVKLYRGQIAASLCVWALGTSPNPLVQRIGLPVHEEGRLLVDASYRVQGHKNIYAIGDCAYVTDPKTNQVDGMNCKEAMMQAKRLGKVMKIDRAGGSAPTHRDSVTHFFCIALGPHDGFLWTKRWGIDFAISGILARKVKEYAWKTASLVKR
ncbi:NAD(P)/FAD-dependent oxidoreductase [Cohnella cellulosilytica]|uniref:NADH:ubiquinone reductase (non-electrogenic) n=1 Tax=Cohnella cellulosilytica TaxID=986710 RepID=A0ABW2FIE5_9BACL